MSAYAHTLGYSAPNITVNTGADITITPHIVSTTRFGYYFENYHDFGYPVGGDVYVFQTSGKGGTTATTTPTALPASYQQNTGYQSGPLDNLTAFNASKAIQLDEAVSWYKSTSFGTHNFKFGYALNRDSNKIAQGFNEPEIQIFTGGTNAASYGAQTPTGVANCTAIEAKDKIAPANGCQGPYGTSCSTTTAPAEGHQLQPQHLRSGFLDCGPWPDPRCRCPRSSRSSSPAKRLGWRSFRRSRSTSAGATRSLRASGAAWDVFRDGKMKVFGSYGVFNDQMKLNVAISSFGGQYWHNCAYALNTPEPYRRSPVIYDSNHRYCNGPNAGSKPTSPATTPAG